MVYNLSETHGVHLYCVGSRNPTVVFESGLDEYGSVSWNSVQGEIGEFIRACSCDRAGILQGVPRNGVTHQWRYRLRQHSCAQKAIGKQADVEVSE
jgi:hypothetical protein